MSELFMECEEEELEPWQRQTPEVNLLGDGKHDDDDDDEPIFVGELSTSKGTINTRPTNNQRNVKTTPVQTGGVGTPRAPRMIMTHNSPQAHLTRGPVPQNIIIPGKGLNNAPRPLTAVPPQPIIINNQGYIMTTPQLPANSAFLASLGKQYPPGTSFTVVPGQQHILQQVTPGKPLPGVIHRPQVHMIHNNVVTLSNVQGPAALSSQPNRSNSTNLQIVSPVIQAKGNSWDYGKRGLPQDQNSTAKKAKQDIGSPHAQEILENGARFCKKCPKCKFDFYQQVVMKDHMVKCCPHLLECVFPSTPKSTYLFASKRIMLVTDFYYGRFEGDKPKLQQQKTPFTYKCQSCLKVLKNNVRFMNHMKHHLELEKQNSESWESHTTCQHCYRQYSTPFQLQCHVESAHSMVESSTNCKICELAFESEQVLLEHMKDNHKPGEMPYVCQVCNYRSSFFTDVDTHFRTAHENTKDLLCPFCLKVLKSGHVYMQHYMKHQKKGINRCGKCRLNFLTYKERVDHKTQHHKTFQKPKALEGLPPGTKVTIRASLTGPSPSSARAAEKSSVSVIPEVPGMKAANVKAQGSTSTTQGSSGGKGKATVSKKLLKQQKNNHVLQSLSIGERRHTCIECYSEIHDFYSHYPMVAICGACKYRTSCKTSFGNHMIRFHSAISKERFRKMRKIPVVLRNLTLVCLNCDFLADAHGTDLMSKHLIDRPHHVCKVILEKEGGAVDDGIRGNKQGMSVLMFPDIQNAETATASMNQRRNMTHSQQQRVISEFRRQEEQREDQTKRITKDRQMQANLMSEERLEKKRYLRKVQDELHESQIEDALIKAEEERIYKEKQLQQEERMAQELARISYEKLRDEKMRQYIKENSVELRELEGKLKSAYLNQERAAQIAEKESMRYETVRQEADIARKMKSEHERASMEQEKQDHKRYEEVVQYQQELEQQLEEKEHKRQEAYEEFLKEKLMVDEIVRKIYEEDQMERQLRLEKITATQRYIEEFKSQQTEWRLMEREKMEAENRRILEFASYQQHKEKSRMEKVREQEQAKEHLHQMLTEKIEMERQQRDEMERVREELCLEEQAEAARQKQIEDMEKRIRQRLELQQTCQEQIAFKEMRRQAEKVEEEAFRQMMMAKFAEDDRIEQMNAQKRRMKQLEHKRAVEKLLEDRRQQYLADKEREAEERAMEQERETLRRQIIEEERQSLLKLHATKLLGYLPKGIFREDDLEHFDEDFRSNFQKRQADIFDEEGWGDDE